MEIQYRLQELKLSGLDITTYSLPMSPDRQESWAKSKYHYIWGWPNCQFDADYIWEKNLSQKFGGLGCMETFTTQVKLQIPSNEISPRQAEEYHAFRSSPNFIVSSCGELNPGEIKGVRLSNSGW
jgi:hypothetical protein